MRGLPKIAVPQRNMVLKQVLIAAIELAPTACFDPEDEPHGVGYGAPGDVNYESGR
jgi:hypothetical protein